MIWKEEFIVSSRCFSEQGLLKEKKVHQYDMER